MEEKQAQDNISAVFSIYEHGNYFVCHFIVYEFEPIKSISVNKKKKKSPYTQS